MLVNPTFVVLWFVTVTWPTTQQAHPQNFPCHCQKHRKQTSSWKLYLPRWFGYELGCKEGNGVVTWARLFYYRHSKAWSWKNIHDGVAVVVPVGEAEKDMNGHDKQCGSRNQPFKALIHVCASNPTENTTEMIRCGHRIRTSGLTNIKGLWMMDDSVLTIPSIGPPDLTTS